MNFPSMLCLEMNSVELDGDMRSLVFGQLVTCSRPMATRQQCVPATGDASSASAPPTDDTARSAWQSVNKTALHVYLLPQPRSTIF